MHIPPEDCAEGWAYAYLTSRSLAHKLNPPEPPRELLKPTAPCAVPEAGRPRELSVATRGDKTPKPTALRAPHKRARLLHTFLHHELQATELMCVALLRFRDTPPAFKRGLLGIAQDELRHMRMYAEHMQALGCDFGDHPVNDWLLRRGLTCQTPTQFVATIGLGFEGANLDHTERFAALFAEAGDPAGAHLQAIVGREEEVHVAFAAHWFRTWTGGLSFSTWQRSLPPPLSPMLMRGRPLHRAARVRAGQPAAFIDALEAFEPV